MEITNSSIEMSGGASTANGAGAAGSISDSTSRSAALRSDGQTDSANLSSAGLLNAKTSELTPNAAKVETVAALVRSGQYQSDTDSVSQALIQGHLR